MAHERDLENLLFLVHELVLAQDAHAQMLGYRDRTVTGLQVAAQDVEQRGLSGAVGAHQPVALPRVELEGRAGEERAVTERLFEV